MPGGDGFTLVDALRRRPATRQLPAVVISGHDRDGSIGTEARARGLPFVPKPLDLRRFRGVLATTFARGRA
jgi:CheY-like chemotaxis protein